MLDIAQSSFPQLDGSGMKIGVLSDTFDLCGDGRCSTTAAIDIISRDLPAAGVQVLAEFSSPAGDEGRAMCQLIHDIAPKASLAFHTAFLGASDFASGIVELAQGGCDVIVDDVSKCSSILERNRVIKPSNSPENRNHPLVDAGCEGVDEDDRIVHISGNV
jgi:hypothetical protein